MAWTVDIAETKGQVALFDRLIADNWRSTVIDLGYGLSDQFFAVMAEIGFEQEARRRGIEPIVLFITNSAPTTARSYAALRQRLPLTTFVPVHNEATSFMFIPQDFPSTRADCALIRIPRLSPIVRGVIDRPGFSFGAYMSKQPGGPTEVHSWIGNIFAQFRSLELRLILGELESRCAPPPNAQSRMRSANRPGAVASSARGARRQELPSMPFESDQRTHRHAELADFLGAAEIRQVDDEAGGDHIGAELLEELYRCLRGAAGGDEIVDQDDPLAALHRILVHLHFVDAVFERIADADALERQLALLADRHEAAGQLVRDGAAENEAARLDAGDPVDLAAGPRLHQLVDVRRNARASPSSVVMSRKMIPGFG